MKTRQEMAREECTRDPIFLFQCRYKGSKTWHTEAVFFSRKEAERWGVLHRYRWKKWRVYCVPATGDLTYVLKMPEAVDAAKAMAEQLAAEDHERRIKEEGDKVLRRHAEVFWRLAEGDEREGD